MNYERKVECGFVVSVNLDITKARTEIDINEICEDCKEWNAGMWLR